MHCGVRDTSRTNEPMMGLVVAAFPRFSPTGKKNGKEGKNPSPSSVHTAAIKVTQIPTITSWDIFATRVKTSSYSLETKLMNQAGHYLTVKKKKKATEAKKPLVNNSGML